MMPEDDVVISGMAGIYPKSNNVEEFAEKLFAKEDLLSDAPNMPVRLGKLNDLTKFDAEFFGFTQPHRVNVMEPMSRMIMEKAYEALIDSGTNPGALKGQNCGVYIAVHSVETEMLTYHKIEKGAYLAQSRSFLANRISHWLGIHGPSYTIDSACSSTLVALEVASKAIRRGDCDSAIVGGCHISLHPAVLLHLLKVGALNPRGESRVFDQNAGGFCKGECIGVFYVQRAKNAKRVYARVVNAHVNHDGWKPYFLAPRGPSQAVLLKRVYEEAKIDLNSVAWIETHATGTLVGDKQEVDAINSVFADRRSPLLIGSVKSNMGHAEAAAGVSSLSKVIIAMESGFIPPNINITTLRKDIEALQNGRIKVVTEKTPWNGGIVGVSGFGMGGVNCHVALESFKKQKVDHGIPNDDLPRIVGVSGRTEEAVDILLRHLGMTSLDSEFVGLLQEIHQQNIPLHTYRGSILLHKNEHCLWKKIEKIDSTSRKTLFVFTNFLSKYKDIFRSLSEIRIFQQSISRSSACLAKFGLKLMHILDDDSQDNSLFHSYISSVVIQVALHDVMCNLGLVPDHIIGCSLGELVCAYADGCLSFEETLSAAFYCAAFLTFERRSGVISVLADIHHSSLVPLMPSNLQLSFPSIITGSESEVTEFFNANEITFSKIRASSSSNIAIIKNVDELKNLLRQIMHPKIKSEKWITWIESKTSDINVEYFVKCTAAPVNFQNMVDFFPADVLNVNFLSSTFCNVAQKSLKGESISISLTDVNKTTKVTDFLTTVGELYLLGKNLDFSQLYPPVLFPVSRGTKMIAPLVRWKHTASWPVAFTSKQETLLSSERTVSISMDDREYSYLAGHEIDSTVLFPGTGYLVLVWETLALMCGKIYTNMPVVFENVRFLRATQMMPKDTILFEIMVHKGTGIFEITEKGHLIATGRVHSPPRIHRGSSIASKPTDNSIILDKLDFYRYILIRGSNYKGLFRSISQINGEGTKARISWMQNWIPYLDGILQMGILHDTRDASYVPVEIEKIVIDTGLHNQIIGSSVTELDAFYDKSTNVIECGGVQIEGVALRSILPKPIRYDPSLQKYYFLPFDNTVHKIPLTELISQFCHVIVDNIGQLRPDVKIAEVFEENLQTHPLAPLVSNFVKEQPLFKSEIKVYSSNGSVVKSSNSDFIVANGNLPLSELVHVIICCDILNQEQKLKSALDSLHDDGFIICCEKANATINVPSNLILCCHALSNDVRCNGFRYILLKKKIKVRNVNKLIKICSDKFSWIKELQEALKINVFARIVLYADQDHYSGILGFFQSLRMERNTDHIRCFLILDENRHFSLEDSFFRQQFEKDVAINVLKNGRWGCYIRQPVDPVLPVSQVDVFHAFVRLNNLKKKSTVKWVTGPLQQSESKNLVHVYYCAVNPTDVLLFTKRVSIETILDDPFKKDHVLGIEFSGRSHCGKRLMGLRSYGCMSSHIELGADNVFFNDVPNNWSLEDAVTVPLAYYTVIYAIVFCSQLKPKESILIHSAGSPAGQAAINLAIHFGCKILVSVSSVNEKLFITEHFPFISKTNIINTSVDSILKVVTEKTNGTGVDVVLDSLSVDQLATNIECLAKNGRYIQLKRVDLRNSNVNVNKLLSKNISLQTALLEDILNLPHVEKVELKNYFDTYVKNGAIKPLHRTVYSYSAIEYAFESSSLPHNFGKHVIQIEPEEDEITAKPREKLRKAYKRFLCHPEKIYVICGGLGGMGMELINWLVIRGAKKVVISSRKGEATGSQLLRINRWKSYGVNVVLVKADISDLAQTTVLLNTANSLGSVDAVFNLAAINNSRMFKNQTPENFISTAGPKFYGTLNLDQISRTKCPALEHFVVFSSVASGFGSLGQTEYALFNSAVERICEQRHRENLPALAIEWGGVGNVGMLVSFLDGNTDDSYCGFRMQPIKSCLEALDQFLCQANTIVTSYITSK